MPFGLPYKKRLTAVILVVALVFGLFIFGMHTVQAAGFICPRSEGCWPDTREGFTQCQNACRGGCVSSDSCTPSQESLSRVSDANKTGFLADGVVGVASYIWWALMYALAAVLSAGLFIVSFFLDNLFVYNVLLSPNNMPAVIQGWIMLRDIVNGVFIMVVLWVAISIIFSLNEGRNKQLLARVIIVALLMNFSMMFVSAVFGFANALAMPFRTAIVQADITNFIVERLKLQTIMQAPSDSGYQSFKTSAIDNKNACPFLNLVDQETVNQLETIGVTGCLNTAGAGAFASLMGEVSKINNQTLTKHWDTIALTISNFFMLLVIISLGGAVFLLIARIVAMVFLAILAPLAFASLIIPFGNTKAKIWDKWLSNLFCWAFTAPAFYFLFYISLLLLRYMTNNLSAPSADIPFFANVMMMLPLVIFLAFLWVSVTLGKKMGCAGAGAAIDIGKAVAGVAVGAGLAAATGGTSLIASGGAAAIGAQRIQKARDWIESKPIVRTVGRPITRRADAYLKDRVDKTKEFEKRFSRMSNKDLAGRAQSALESQPARVAAARVLQQRGGAALGAFNTPAARQRAIDLAAQYGLQKELVENMPQHATTRNVQGLPDNATRRDAIWRTIRDNKKKHEIVPSAYAPETPERNDVLAGILATANRDEARQILRQNSDMSRALHQFTRDPQNAQQFVELRTQNQHLAGIERLLNTHLGRSLTFAPPTPAPTPPQPPQSPTTGETQTT